MFRLIELPYRKDGLEPVISAQTLDFHHGKHLQGYVDNLNKLLEGSEFEGMVLEDIVRKTPAGAIFNNAGQILNHELYFMQFKPVSEALQAPTGALAMQIEKQWGTLDAFKSEFEAKGVGLFGSGWVWLSADALETSSDLRCMGTCLLSRLPKPPSRSPLRTLAGHRLADNRRTVYGG